MMHEIVDEVFEKVEAKREKLKELAERVVGL